MRDGETVLANAPTSGLDTDIIVNWMVGRDVDALFPPRNAMAVGKPVLEVAGLCGRGFDGCSFSVNAGEILGIGGLVGAGIAAGGHILPVRDAPDRAADAMLELQCVRVPERPPVGICAEARAIGRCPDNTATPVVAFTRTSCAPASPQKPLSGERR